jgi:hypothetical protein
VFFHRRTEGIPTENTEFWKKEKQRLISAANSGDVLVTPGISECEKRIKNMALALPTVVNALSRIIRKRQLSAGRCRVEGMKMIVGQTDFKPSPSVGTVSCRTKKMLDCFGVRKDLCIFAAVHYQ